MSIRVKICGITNYKDAKAAVDYGADAVGFIFAPSPRRIDVKAARNIIFKLPPFITKIGVFVNAPKSSVLKILNSCRLDALQFHGQESDKYCAYFRKYCKIIKAFRIKDKASFKEVTQYKNVDAYLFDSYIKGIRGGTGKVLPYKLLRNKRFAKPIIISGGISIKNYKMIAKDLTPFGLDICSSIEAKPGKKKHNIMKKLIKGVREI